MAELIESILTRVRTYQVPLWRYQSHPLLNPYRLASQGYLVAGQDLLRCETCHHQVALDPDSDDLPADLPESLQQHQQQCLFAQEEGSTISDSLLYMSLQDLLTAIDKVSAKSAAGLPLLNSKALLSFVGSNSFLFNKVLSLYEIDPQHFKISLMLQLTGWHISRQQEQDCLSCYFCGRNVALSLFDTLTEDRHDPQRERETPEERLFNPIEEHRYFCMWVEGGWLTFLQNLEDKFSEVKVFKFKTAPLETQRVRMHIERYLDGFREKVEGVLHKLKKNTGKVTTLCKSLGEDYVLAVAEEDNERDVKRLRDKEHDIELQEAGVAEGMKNLFKKVKIN